MDWCEGSLDRKLVARNVGFFETEGFLPEMRHRRLKALQISHEILSRLSPSLEGSAAKIVATPEPEYSSRVAIQRTPVCGTLKITKKKLRL